MGLSGPLIFGSVSRRLRPPPPPAASSTHNLLTHTHLSSPTCPHTSCYHTSCPHTSCHHTSCRHTSCPTHNLLTHTHLVLTNLTSHILSSHLLSSHILSSHILSSHLLSSHILSSHILSSHILSSHNFVVTQLAHTQFARPDTCPHRRGTWRHLSSLCVAGVALGDMYLHFAWQAWHLVTSTSTFVSRGKRGTYGIGLAPVARLGRSGTRGRCGCWRGRRGIWRHAPWFHVAGVALGDIDLYLRFTWQAWHVWPYGIELALVARLCRSGTRGRCGCWRGRCGIWRHAPWFHVAGVALGDIDLYLRFTWQAWLFTLRGRRGTW